MSNPGPAWSLTADLKPASGTPTPPPPADPTMPPDRDWAGASEAVRTTVKWLVTALAAVGAMLFAKGFVNTPTLSWTENRWQLLAAWGLGVLGLVGVGTLILLAVHVLRPIMVDVLDLPADFQALVAATPARYLPTGCATLADFHQGYRRWQRAVLTSSQQLADMDRAIAQMPSGQAKTQLEAQRTAAANAREVILHNWAVYQAARVTLIERAEFFLAAQGLSWKRIAIMVGAGVVAALGGIGYVLALSSPAKPDKAESASPASAPVIGELIREDTDAGDALWSTLGLSSCQASPSMPRVAVVVSGGKGTSTDPYTVTTLPSPTCHAQTFSVVAGVATVAVPKPIEITYVPPTPRSLTTQSP